MALTRLDDLAFQLSNILPLSHRIQFGFSLLLSLEMCKGSCPPSHGVSFYPSSKTAKFSESRDISEYYYFIVLDLRHRLEDVKDLAAMFFHAVALTAIYEADAAGCHTVTRISWAVPYKCINQHVPLEQHSFLGRHCCHCIFYELPLAIPSRENSRLRQKPLQGHIHYTSRCSTLPVAYA